MTFHPFITEYISKAEPFAQPILNELRMIVHQFCPEARETVKWGMPHFDYKGAILCSMASFKKHCAFGFWHESLLKDEHGILRGEERNGMGSLGKIHSMEELPAADKLGTLILQAMDLIDAGVKVPKTAPKDRKELEIPAILIKALDEHPVAKDVFEKFSYSHKREYVEWINEAKTDATRERRLKPRCRICSKARRKSGNTKNKNRHLRPIRVKLTASLSLFFA